MQRLRQLGAAHIVHVQHRRAQARPLEQLRLGVPVRLHRAVVVQVVLGEVGEDRDPHPGAVEAPLDDADRRRLDGAGGEPLVGEPAELRLQQDRVGRREAGELHMGRTARAQRADQAARDGPVHVEGNRLEREDHADFVAGMRSPDMERQGPQVFVHPDPPDCIGLIQHLVQAYLIRFADKERKLLSEIEHALEKMRAGEYGVCEGTEEPIGFKRLELRPWTRYSVAYKEQMERDRQQHRR